MKRCFIVDHRNGQVIYKNGRPWGFHTFHPIRFEWTDVGWAVHILSFCVFLTDNLNHVAYNGVVMFGVGRDGFFFSLKPNDVVIPLWPPKKLIGFLKEVLHARRRT